MVDIRVSEPVNHNGKSYGSVLLEYLLETSNLKMSTNYVAETSQLFHEGRTCFIIISTTPCSCFELVYSNMDIFKLGINIQMVHEILTTNIK